MKKFIEQQLRLASWHFFILVLNRGGWVKQIRCISICFHFFVSCISNYQGLNGSCEFPAHLLHLNCLNLCLLLMQRHQLSIVFRAILSEKKELILMFCTLALCPTTWRCHLLRLWRTHCWSCLRSTSSGEVSIVKYLIKDRERKKVDKETKENLVNRLNVGRLEGNNSFRGASFPSVPPTNLKGKSFHPYCPKGKTNHLKQI